MTDFNAGAPAPMDLSNFAADDVVQFVPTNPVTGKPIIGADGNPWTWLIAGPGHDVAVQQRNASMREALKDQRRSQRERDREAIDEQDTIKKGHAFVAARVLGWSPISFGGSGLTFSTNAAIDLLGNPRFQWLTAQINRFLQDDASFLPELPTI